MKTNTLIYTEEFVLNELTALLKELSDNEEIVYIGELFEKKNYSRQRYSEWITTYSQVKEIIRISDTLKEILETRAVKGAMTNKLNSTFIIFHLKNNYKWVDKSEVANNNTNLNLEVEDSKELNDLLKDNKLI